MQSVLLLGQQRRVPALLLAKHQQADDCFCPGLCSLVRSRLVQHHFYHLHYLSVFNNNKHHQHHHQSDFNDNVRDFNDDESNKHHNFGVVDNNLSLFNNNKREQHHH